MSTETAKLNRGGGKGVGRWEWGGEGWGGAAMGEEGDYKL